MERKIIEVAKASYRRCKVANGFFEAFYEEFFRVCPPAQPMFATTDFERQHKLLRHALGLLLNYPSRQKSEPPILERLAVRHSKADLDIEPPLYDSFLEALITTVGKFDRQYSAEIGDAWRRAVAPGMEYMKSKY